MVTGEGKTLVARLADDLNALDGQGASRVSWTLEARARPQPFGMRQTNQQRNGVAA
jgi:preprotein translocase subunit SecA